jgi:hypothetical protein
MNERIIKLSTWVMNDLERRILMDIRDEMPSVIIETDMDSLKGTSRIVKVKVNDEGLRVLHNECKVTARNWAGEYSYDKSNSEARNEYLIWSRAEARLASLLAE